MATKLGTAVVVGPGVLDTISSRCVVLPWKAEVLLRCCLTHYASQLCLYRLEEILLLHIEHILAVGRSIFMHAKLQHLYSISSGPILHLTTLHGSLFRALELGMAMLPIIRGTKPMVTMLSSTGPMHRTAPSLMPDILNTSITMNLL